MDDGTTARLAPDHWVMSTTTANAGKVMQHLAFCHQVLWPELDVQMVSVTEQWAQYAVAGPRSRELLQRLLGDAADLSNEAFPYLACAEFRLGQIPARLFRISFSGELGYEIAVPAGYGGALARRLADTGRDFGATPYGTEALSVMRIEKGHLAGNELNGQTVARDLGLGRMMSTKKDFVGRWMAARPALVDPQRPSLVGLKPVQPGDRLRAGARNRPRLHDLDGLQPDARPLDRIGPARARGPADRRDNPRLRSGAIRRHRGRGRVTGIRRPRGSSCSCVTWFMKAPSPACAQPARAMVSSPSNGWVWQSPL
jgi:glycine cleavage system aminomethyltransferase T